MGFFDKSEELKTMQIYIDRYSEIKDDMNEINNKICNINSEIVHTRNVLLIVITLFGIFTPLLFHLHSEKIDAKFETINNQQQAIIKQIDEIKQELKNLKINKK